jgi:hypothetical protein
VAVLEWLKWRYFTGVGQVDFFLLGGNYIISRMNIMENLYIEHFRQLQLLIDKQSHAQDNPLFKLISTHQPDLHVSQP